MRSADLALVFFLLSPLSPARAQGTVLDGYSPIVEWLALSAEPVRPIHVSVLPNGALYFLEPYFQMDPDRHEVAPATAVQIKTLPPPPLSRVCDGTTGICELKKLTCSGHALTADGKLFFGGGSAGQFRYDDSRDSIAGNGISASLMFDPVLNKWIMNPDAIGARSATSQALRWYPAVTRLADSRMMLTGGYDNVQPTTTFNRSVEVFDLVTRDWSVTSDFNDTPEGIANPDYPHVYQMPFGHVDRATGVKYDVVMMLGGSSEPMLLFMNGKKSTWQRSGKLRPGAQAFQDATAPQGTVPNHGSSSALLPLRLPESNWGYTNGSVINVGGEHESTMEGNIDVYDPGRNQWRESIPMNTLRHHPNATILPDGRILILAGHADSGVDGTGYAEYIDPKYSFSHSVGIAHMPEVRGYHSMVVLLPDGRVFVGGGNDDGRSGTEKSNFRYYYPDYMFKARPEVVATARQIQIGVSFPVLVPYLTRVNEIALLALGSMTHSFDMSQRSVQLRLLPVHRTVKYQSKRLVRVTDLSQCSGGAVTCYDRYVAQAPTATNLASPGHYMLFALDENRVPSLGKIVKLVP